MRFKGGYRSDDQRKAIFANMARRDGNIRNSRSSPVPDIGNNKKVPEFAGDEEERLFLESYPVDKLWIPPEMRSLGILDKCKKDGKKKGYATLLSIYPGKSKADAEQREKALKILKELENKGYVQLSNKGKDVEIRIMPWGYAQAVKDQKGQYAQALTKSKLDLNKIRDGVKKDRQLRIKDAEEMLKELENIKKYHLSGSSAENQEELEENIERTKLRISGLGSNELKVYGDDDLVADVKYVLDNYFDIDPSFLTENVLFVQFDPSQENPEVALAALGFNKKNGSPIDLVLDVYPNNSIYQRGHDIKKDNHYLDAILHELTHWSRMTDARRPYLSKILTMAKIPEEVDVEEKHTILESISRLGQRVPEGVFGYYQFLEPGEAGLFYKKGEFANKPQAHDNIMLTMNKSLKSDISLSQIAENLLMRKNTTKINRLGLKPTNDGWAEWVDTGTGKKYNFYITDPKKFNIETLAKNTDLKDGISGNENIYGWKGGKKYLVLSKKT